MVHIEIEFNIVEGTRVYEVFYVRLQWKRGDKWIFNGSDYVNVLLHNSTLSKECEMLKVGEHLKDHRQLCN